MPATPEPRVRTRSAASHALLSAALGGLLCLGTACSSGPGGGGGASTGGTGGSATDAGQDAAALPYCTNLADVRTVTSTTVETLTEAQFKTMCDAKGGSFEIVAECSGHATCKGFSYDDGTVSGNPPQLTEHTCRGVNTCAGYSCVICGDAGTT